MTRLDLPVRDPLDRLAAILQTGPDAEVLARVTGSRAPARIERVHFSGRRPIQVVVSQADRISVAELYYAAADAEAERIRGSLAKGRRGLKAALDTDAIKADPTTGLVLRRPGLDERLPGLRLLFDAAAAREMVRRIEGRDPGPLDVDLLAHRLGKRAVLSLAGTDGVTRFARLRTDKSRSGATAFARHRALWEATRSDPCLSLPEPLGEDPRLGLSLFAQLKGATPQLDGSSALSDGRAITRALRRLQSLDIPGLPLHDGAAEANLLAAWWHRLQRVFPDLAVTLAAPVDAVCSELEDLDVAPAPCHRDLHEKQILIEGDRAGYLDFDTLSLADPALDAGNLMAHLFLAGVAVGQPETTLGATLADELSDLSPRRYALWRRTALLRLCMIYAFSDMRPDHREILLAEAMKPHD